MLVTYKAFFLIIRPSLTDNDVTAKRFPIEDEVDEKHSIFRRVFILLARIQAKRDRFDPFIFFRSVPYQDKVFKSLFAYQRLPEIVHGVDEMRQKDQTMNIYI